MAMVAAADHSAAVSRPVNGGGVDRVQVLRIWVMLTLQYCGFGLAWGNPISTPEFLLAGEDREGRFELHVAGNRPAAVLMQGNRPTRNRPIISSFEQGWQVNFSRYRSQLHRLA